MECPTVHTFMARHEAVPGQRVEQQMEVDDSCVWLPARHQLLDGLVVERRVDGEEAPELVVGADVVSGKHVQPTEAAEQHVLRRPATDAAQAAQALDGGGIVQPFQALQIQIAGDDRPRSLDDRARLGRAEAVTLELVRLEGCEVLGAGERTQAARVIGHRPPMVGGESVEQVDPDRKRQLLAGDAVDQCLEDGGKRGGLSPRIRPASGPSRGSCAAFVAKAERSTVSPSSLSSALRTSSSTDRSIGLPASRTDRRGSSNAPS